MKSELEPDDLGLRAVLRESRPAAALPARFQEGVWRRIERAELLAEASPGSWLDRWVERLLRPRLALGGLVALLVVSGFAGVLSGTVSAKHAAQERYLAAVAPHSFR